jgi:hypothetical protein
MQDRDGDLFSISRAEFLDHYRQFVGEQLQAGSAWRSPHRFHLPQGQTVSAMPRLAPVRSVRSAFRFRIWLIALFFVVQAQLSWFKRVTALF